VKENNRYAGKNGTSEVNIGSHESEVNMSSG